MCSPIPLFVVSSTPAFPFNVSTTCRAFWLHRDGNWKSLCILSISFWTFTIGFPFPWRTKNLFVVVVGGRNLRIHKSNVPCYQSNNTLIHSDDCIRWLVLSDSKKFRSSQALSTRVIQLQKYNKINSERTSGTACSGHPQVPLLQGLEHRSCAPRPGSRSCRRSLSLAIRNSSSVMFVATAGLWKCPKITTLSKLRRRML